MAERILRDIVTLSVNEAYTETDLDQTELAIRRVVEWYHAQQEAKSHS